MGLQAEKRDDDNFEPFGRVCFISNVHIKSLFQSEKIKKNYCFGSLGKQVVLMLDLSPERGSMLQADLQSNLLFWFPHWFVFTPRSEGENKNSSAGVEKALLKIIVLIAAHLGWFHRQVVRERDTLTLLEGFWLLSLLVLIDHVNIQCRGSKATNYLKNQPKW